MPKSFRINDSSKIQILTNEKTNRIVWSKAKSHVQNKNPSLIFTGSSDKIIKIRTHEANSIKKLQGHTGTITALLHLSECHRLISGSSDTKIKIWSLLNECNECLKTLEGHQSSISSLVALPSDNRNKFISASQFDKTFRIWSVEGGQCLKIIHDSNSGATSSLIFGAKHEELFTASWDRTIKVWNIQSGKFLLTLRGHSSWINCLMFKK